VSAGRRSFGLFELTALLFLGPCVFRLSFIKSPIPPSSVSDLKAKKDATSFEDRVAADLAANPLLKRTADSQVCLMGEVCRISRPIPVTLHQALSTAMSLEEIKETFDTDIKVHSAHNVALMSTWVLSLLFVSGSRISG